MNFLSKFIKKLKELDSFEFKERNSSIEFILVKDTLKVNPFKKKSNVSLLTKFELKNMVISEIYFSNKKKDLNKKINNILEDIETKNKIFKNIQELFISDYNDFIFFEDFVNQIYNELLRKADFYNLDVFKNELKTLLIDKYFLKENEIKKNKFIKNLKD